MVATSLVCHPATPSRFVKCIEVAASVSSAGELKLEYRAEGEIGRLHVPALIASSRADMLWKHTCFEAFVCARGDPGYFELNFSPSTQWAAYRLEGYREGMRLAQALDPLAVSVTRDDASLVLEVKVPLAQVGASEPSWHLALAAVIEDEAGEISYWALVHPSGKPDFHHRDGFVLSLEREER